MKRQLNKEEEELTKKGVTRLTEEVTDLKENLDYNQDLKRKEKFLREFDDKWRNILRTRKDKEDEIVLNQMDKLIKEKEGIIKEMDSHLKEGVESETPAGVG